MQHIGETYEIERFHRHHNGDVDFGAGLFHGNHGFVVATEEILAQPCVRVYRFHIAFDGHCGRKIMQFCFMRLIWQRSAPWIVFVVPQISGKTRITKPAMS